MTKNTSALYFRSCDCEFARTIQIGTSRANKEIRVVESKWDLSMIRDSDVRLGMLGQEVRKGTLFYSHNFIACKDTYSFQIAASFSDILSKTRLNLKRKAFWNGKRIDGIRTFKQVTKCTFKYKNKLFSKNIKLLQQRSHSHEACMV